MSRIIAYFARGCLALIPMAATIYITWAIITWADTLLGTTIPGFGVVVALTVPTLIGFLLSNVIGRRLYWLFDKVMARVPFIKLLYTSIRDLIETFVGDKTSGGTPVSVRISPESDTRIMGLLTRDQLAAFSMPGHVAVYIPQAYNIGGQVLAVPKDQVEILEGVSASQMLTFMMSGGASGPGATSESPL